MSEFVSIDPTDDAYWRAIILFGQNSMSYKFALGKTLLELAGRGQTFVSLEDLAVPYCQSPHRTPEGCVEAGDIPIQPFYGCM